MLSPKSSAKPNSSLFDTGIQFGFFYSSLVPHGEWIEVESGIRVWRPLHIPHLWRPYLFGRWVWTDYGWYWMSNEPFGWITYHYGRWYNDDYYGWVWMPDDVWAPAWVEWRYNDDYIGWAPLPPYATLDMTLGIRFTTHWIAPPHYWNIVRYSHFGTVIRYLDTAPEEYARRFIRMGRTGSQYGIDHERIIDRGVDRATIERRGNVRFTKTEVRAIREHSGERIAQSNNKQRTEFIEVYRPTKDEMQRSTEFIETKRGERNLSIDINNIQKQRFESPLRSDARLPRDKIRADAQQHQPGLQKEIRQDKQSRERTLQMQERQSQRHRQEMRRELIQRHERNPRPTPPAVREAQQQRRGLGKENSRMIQPSKPAQQMRSEYKSRR